MGPGKSSSLPAPPAGYGDFLFEIKAQIRQRQFQALRAANPELLALYWWLGENISQRQLALSGGKGVVENLARDLQAEFPGRNGFSAQNLWLMRQFFNEYCDKPKLQPLVREISWAKNLVILARCKDDLERDFYLRATARFGWTKSVLQHQLDNHRYAQYLNGQTNFDVAVQGSIKAQALLAVKDHYTFDFLGLAEEHSERELEQALVRNLHGFLSEMGGAFTFVGNQYRLEGENPPIGIVICRSKTKTMVEYALRTMTRPLGIATYMSPRNCPPATATTCPARSRLQRACKAGPGTTTDIPSRQA